MWIYFIEQVWTQNDVEWLNYGWLVDELSLRFWERWHNDKIASQAYPTRSMEFNNDWIDL